MESRSRPCRHGRDPSPTDDERDRVARPDGWREAYAKSPACPRLSRAGGAQTWNGRRQRSELTGTGVRRCSGPGDGVMDGHAGQPREPRVGPGVTYVDHQMRTPAGTGEELLTPTGPVEARHGTGREPCRAHRSRNIPVCGAELWAARRSRLSVRPANAARSAAPRAGNTTGICSWKATSYARIATAGALSVLALLPSSRCPASRSLPSRVRTKSTRRG